MNNYIAITIGDINGIGIEILLDCKKNKKINKFVLFTNYNILKKFLTKKNIKIKINKFNKNFKYISNSLNIYDFKAKNNEENTIESIKYAFKYCKKKFFIGMITLPLRKDLIIKKIDKNFIGQTEYLQQLNKKNTTNMIFNHKNLIISTLTTHININNVNKTLKRKNFIFNKIKSLNRTLKIDFNIKKPKILISGINPHAGESGLIGSEEKLILIPEIKKAINMKINIKGPLSADSMINRNNLNNFDCYLFIFHDQALIPFKYISNYSGVNITSNLDIIRTSPDHGTAYNLVGKKLASNKSFINCFKIIKKIYKNRNKNDKIKKIS